MAIACSPTPSALLAAAKCISCLTPRQRRAVSTALLCQISDQGGMNIVPPGSVYTGSPPEFDIAIQPNTYYRITWGANDVSANICGDAYTSGGVGTSNIFYSGSCTLAKLFGTAAGTTVTALIIPVHNVKSPPTGFLFTLITGPSAQASWNTPPGAGPGQSGVVSTEVWTSTDGVTYALAGTVVAPGTSLTLTAPAVGTVLFAKARWIYDDGGNGGFCTAQETFGNVTDWANRVVTNGGGAVSSATMQAMNTFYNSLNAVGTLIPKVKAMLCCTPGGLIEARTPLIKTFGNDPWATIGTLTVNANGLIATAGNSCLGSGVLPSACFASTSTGGLSAYVFTTTNADAAAVDIGCNSGVATSCQLYTNFNGSPGQAFGQIYNNTTGSCGGSSQGTGFYSASVTAAAAAALYYGSSLGFQTLGTIATGGGTRPGIEIYAMGLNASGATNGTTTVRRYSFFAIHDGLTQSEAQSLFNAVQALRVALGGGFI